MKRPRADDNNVMGAGANKRGSAGADLRAPDYRMPRREQGGGAGGAARPQGQAQGQQGQQLTQTDALSYLHDVKEHFKFEKHVYHEFLEIMKEFKNKRIDTADVILRIKELFKGHDALILGFNTFVPRGYEIQLTAEERAQGAQERERKALAAQGQQAAQAPPAAPPAAPPRSQGQGGQDAAKHGKRLVEYDQAFTYVNKIRSRFRDDAPVYNSFLEILNMYRKMQKNITQVYDEVEKLFAGRNQDLLDEFIYFLPDNTAPGLARNAAGALVQGMKKGAAGRGMGGRMPGMTDEMYGMNDSDVRRMINKRKSARRADELIRRQTAGEMDGEGAEDPNSMKSGNLQKELEFFDKVKARLRNREAFQDLLKCLNIFNQDMCSKTELSSLVYDIIGRFPDLVQGFNDLIVRCEAMDIDLGEAARAKDGRLSVKDMQEMKNVISAREKYLTRPISELDLSACDRCGPSYRLLPKNFPKAACSQRNQLCHQVLNDDWVSVTSGSEDYSFKQMRKNQYEESLFRCEDDRFELDMVIETNTATMKLLEKLDEQVKKMTTEEQTAFRLPDEMLSSVHLRCVERIYGDHGSDIKELLIRNPSVAIGVILNRLKQKDEEWRKCRDDMNIVWGEVYFKNYQKSLDHRSFYFKQMDKKSLSTRGMLAEVREVNERRKREDHNVIIAAAANRRPEESDLKFPFQVAQAHNDVYEIVKYSIRECFCHTPDQGEKLLEFWRTFVEPFFGLPARPEEPPLVDSEEEEEKAEEEDTKKTPEKMGAKEVHETGLLMEAEDVEVEEGTKEEGADAAPEVAKDEDKMDEDGEVEGTGRSNGDSAGVRQNGTEVSVEDRTEAPGAASASEWTAGEDGPASMDTEIAPTDAVANGEAKVDAPTKQAEEVEEEDEEGEIAAEDEDEDEEGGHDKSNEVKKEGEEEEEEPEQEAFTGCKPLAPPAEIPQEGEDGPIPPAIASRVFYGNDNFYIFFRLHQYLYERICAAHSEAARVQALQEAEAGEEGKEQDDGPKETVLQTFFNMLFSMLGGNLESSKYEDECRALLGNNAYVLFTLDKLIVKLTRHLQTLQNDDMAMKLLMLHNYEMGRKDSFRDDTYYANASVLLHEEPCYRIHLDPKSEMNLQLMDGNGPDRDRDRLGLVMDNSFSAYLQDFLRGGDTKSRKGLFLQRNIQHHGDSKAAMSKVEMYNGLECKISSNNCKVSYVLETEDLFFRYQRGDKEKRAKAATATTRRREEKKWRHVGVPAT
mmetsp:Transcript_24143/g.29248  ORF Transcript_24143/g.29248 Transcript_24143/m.29248 type:complete len:1244 (-) Transcript_24143:506-4237(-)